MATLTPARRSVAAALLFLLAAVLAGISPGPDRTIYQTFGVTEALLAFLLTYLLVVGGAWQRAPGVTGGVALAYGTVANGQLLSLLLPPPGVVQWVAVVGFLFVALASLAITSRQRLVGILAGAATLLALLKFSVIPFVWARSGPQPGEAFGLGSGLDRIRRMVVEYEPISAEGQMVGVAAIGLWIVATALLWAGSDPGDPRGSAAPVDAPREPPAIQRPDD